MLRREKNAAFAQLPAHEQHPPHARDKEQDDRILRAYRERVARVNRAIERQQQARDKRQAWWAEIDGLYRSLVGYIDQHSEALHPYTGKVAAPSGEPRKAVDQLRRKIEELRADRRQIAAAPIPAAEAKQRIASQVGELAERGRPNVAPWPTTCLRRGRSDDG